jgi:hypothetical protein
MQTEKPRNSKLFSCCDFAVTMKYLVTGVVQREVFQKSPSDGKTMIADHGRINSTNPRRA